MRNKSKNKSDGQVIMITVVAFLVISLAVIAGVAVPTSNQVKSVLDLKHSKQGYLSADSTNEEVLYRLNKRWLSFSYVGDVTLPFSNGRNATSTISGMASPKIITSEGTDGLTTRYGKSTISQGVGVAFNYGVQVGDGGISITGNHAYVDGNVYSNGDVTDGGNLSDGSVTGSIFAANSGLTPDVNNESPLAEGVTNFGKTSTARDLAQSFTVSQSLPVHSIKMYIKKYDTPGYTTTIQIVSDTGGNPDLANVLATADLNSGQVPTSPSSPIFLEVVLNGSQSLSVGTTYWLVVKNSAKKVSDSYDNSKYYQVGNNVSDYSGGTLKTYNIAGAGTWSSVPNTDINFDVILGKSSEIAGVDAGGIARAHTVRNINAGGNIYCKVESGNNKSCITTEDDPTPQGFPISDANIYEWREAALAGGSIGSKSISGTEDLGPKKVSGNLTISGTMNLTGTLWVTGDLTIDDHGVINLDSSYGTGSGVIVVNGLTTIGTQAEFNNADAGSYIGIFSTSTSVSLGSPAIALTSTQAAGDVIVNAQNGLIVIGGNHASVREATAYKMAITGTDSKVEYVTGLADVDFISGPSGAWNVDSWAEVASP